MTSLNSLLFIRQSLIEDKVIDFNINPKADGGVSISTGHCSIIANVFSDKSPEMLQIDNFFVNPYARNQGIGFQLLLKLVNWAKENNIKYLIGYETNEFNIPFKLRQKIPNTFSFRAYQRYDKPGNVGDILNPENENTKKYFNKFVKADWGPILFTVL